MGSRMSTSVRCSSRTARLGDGVQLRKSTEGNLAVNFVEGFFDLVAGRPCRGRCFLPPGDLVGWNFSENPVKPEAPGRPEHCPMKSPRLRTPLVEDGLTDADGDGTFLRDDQSIFTKQSGRAGQPAAPCRGKLVELDEVTDTGAGQPAAWGRAEVGRARGLHPDFANGAEPDAAGRGCAWASAWPRTTRGILRRPRDQSTEGLGQTHATPALAATPIPGSLVRFASTKPGTPSEGRDRDGGVQSKEHKSRGVLAGGHGWLGRDAPTAPGYSGNTPGGRLADREPRDSTGQG